MPVREIGELLPETAEVVEEYLARLDAGFCQVSRDIAEDILADVLAGFLEALTPSSPPDDARSVALRFGEPDIIAADLCAEVNRGLIDGSGQGRAEPMGRVMGMPFDVSVPTPDRVRLRIWNPEDPRIFTPRLLGLGWSVNFAAIAVRTGMIRPDDEDEPFGSVPEPLLWAALAVPTSISLLSVLAVSVRWGSLPSRLPTHWDIHGQVDGYSSPAVSLLVPTSIALAALAYAVWSFATGRSKAARAVSVAFASIFAVIAGGIILAVLLWDTGVDLGWWWPWAMVLTSLLLPFLVLLSLARAGRSEEIRRDLGK